MITPPNIKIGDRIKIISTARKITQAELDFGVEILSSWGLKVEYGDHLFAEDHQYAGNDDQRTIDLQEALDDEGIKAVFCARGGYGTARFIDQIDFSRFKKSPKWIVGYSDVTVLHCHLQKILQTESLHASMLINFKNNSEESLSKLKSVLFGTQLSYDIKGNVLNRSGTTRNELIGGNLSILYSLNGSRSFPDTKGKILFIEDLDEYLYHVDRMMMNLKRSGVLANISALVVGGMTDMNDNQVPFGKSAKEIIVDAVSEYDYPVCFDFPAGHLDDNRPLILGRKATLDVSSTSVQLSF